MYRDVESGEIVTVEQLENEWKANDYKSLSGDDVTLKEYIDLCLVENSGTLERIT